MKKLLFFLFFFTSAHAKVGLLELEFDRPIDQASVIYTKFAIEEFKKQGVSSIVLRLNTPGGQVFAATEIAEALQNVQLIDSIPVIAFIDSRAWSAGALLAYCCASIAIVENESSMGAAEPVITTGQAAAPETASEKINSALRAEFANAAKSHGRDPDIARAMVDKEIQLVRNGVVISEKGKLLTLNASELIEYGVAELALPQGSDIHTLVGDEEIIRYSDWRVSFFAFLSHPLIASLLFMGLMIGGYMELSTPGFGIPGITALTCLFFVLLSSFSIYTVHWIEVITLLAGVFLLLLEVFVIPGFGVAGVAGTMLLLIGLFVLIVPGLGDIAYSFDANELTLAASHISRYLLYMLVAFLLSLVLIAFLARKLALHPKLLGHLVSEGSEEVTFSRNLPPIGSTFILIAPCRPTGTIAHEGRIVEVHAVEHIDSSEIVEIISHSGGKCTVKKID